MSVKDKKRGRPVRSQSLLTAELIVGCARSLMKVEGKVPSIRRIATELGVDAMAIYYYFTNKSALLEAVTLSLVEEIYVPVEADNWQPEVEQLCKSYLLLLQQHPGLLDTLLSMTSFGPAQLFSERLSVALGVLKLAPGRFEQVRDLLADYLHGAALAMQCRPGELGVACVEGPLRLIYDGLEGGGGH